MFLWPLYIHLSETALVIHQPLQVRAKVLLSVYMSQEWQRENQKIRPIYYSTPVLGAQFIESLLAPTCCPEPVLCSAMH